MAERKELIPLQHSNVTQLTHKGEKRDWIVKTNQTDQELFILPKHFTEADVFKILEFARKFEIEAFNIGINFEKNKNIKQNKEKQEQYNKQIKIARDENERLASKLMKLIGAKEE